MQCCRPLTGGHLKVCAQAHRLEVIQQPGTLRPQRSGRSADTWADVLQAEMAHLVQDIGPTWLQAPLSLEDTAERHVRPQLREVGLLHTWSG